MKDWKSSGYGLWIPGLGIWTRSALAEVSCAECSGSYLDQSHNTVECVITRPGPVCFHRPSPNFWQSTDGTVWQITVNIMYCWRFDAPRETVYHLAPRQLMPDSGNSCI